MARKLTLSAYDKQHLKNLLRQAQTLRDIFGSATDKAVAIGAATGFCDPEGEFLFDKFPAIKERVRKLFDGLHDQLTTTISDGNRREWLLSEAKNDEMVQKLCKRAGISTDRVKEWLQPNMTALDSFQGRKERGMGLSDRVWRLTDQFKGELEMALELGLGDGKSAADLSRDVRGYLNEPHKLFRRVRNEKGQLRLSKSAAAYRPGQGVYRSSYKNALRLTATENNMAYRTADHERWQQLDFVIGIEILLSNNHPCEDICDELAGVYPKTFKFVGWHPFCRCIAVPKLADEDEFMNRINAELADEAVPEGGYSGEITEYPDAFTTWVQNNAERIENATTQPYFVRDNHAIVNNILNESLPHYGNAMKLSRAAKKKAFELYSDSLPPTLTQEQTEQIKSIACELGLNVKDVKPMTFNDADNGRANIIKDNMNCQSCIVAHEARLRGLDVTAVKYDNRQGSATYQLSERFQNAFINPKTGKIPTPTIIKSDTPEKTVTKLTSGITSTGRYIVGYNGKVSGHVFIAERFPNGEIIFYDPQTNDFINVAEFVDVEYFELLKIDRLLFNKSLFTKVISRI